MSERGTEDDAVSRRELLSQQFDAAQEEAENGVVVCCRYDLTEEAEDKIKKKEMQGGPSKYSIMGYDNEREKHVFEDKAAAKAFIVEELDAMWGDKVDEDNEE